MSADSRPVPANRTLLATACLAALASGMTAATDGRDAGSGGLALTWFLLLYLVYRGSQGAWVAACTLSATAAILLCYVAIGSWLPDASWTAEAHAGPTGLLNGLLLLLLNSRPVRVLVGRGPRADPDRSTAYVLASNGRG